MLFALKFNLARRVGRHASHGEIYDSTMSSGSLQVKTRNWTDALGEDRQKTFPFPMGSVSSPSEVNALLAPYLVVTLLIHCPISCCHMCGIAPQPCHEIVHVSSLCPRPSSSMVLLLLGTCYSMRVVEVAFS